MIGIPPIENSTGLFQMYSTVNVGRMEGDGYNRWNGF